MVEQVSDGARRFVITSATFFVLGQFAIVLDTQRRVVVTLVLYGFVLHMLFGKGYALIPSYFDRTLAFGRAPFLQLPLSALGVLGLVAAAYDVPYTYVAGSVLWASGVGLFVGTIFWTVRDNLLGSETGTSNANAKRASVDRIANFFVPIALFYLVAGSVEQLALAVDGPTLFVSTPSQVSHLLAAGTAGLLLFAIGFRLFPRFLVEHPPTLLVGVVLVAGAVGPVTIAVGLYANLLVIALVVESVAVVGFAVTVLVLFVRSSRRRVGFYSVLCGMSAGTLGVFLAALLSVGGRTTPIITAHYRLMLVGFLGLSILGAAYQFYPPSVGVLPGSTDRTALLSILLLSLGLGVQVCGLVGEMPLITTVGEISALAGAVVYAYLLGSVFRRR
jgi:hypothetical protein